MESILYRVIETIRTTKGISMKIFTPYIVSARKKFTLIELLLVIAIVAILLSIGAGGIFVIGQGSQIRQGSVALGGKCLIARAKAAATYSYIAVLLPTTDEDFPEEYRARSAGLCVVEVDSSSNNNNNTMQFKFISWVDGQDWAFLPEGCAILGQVPNVDNESSVRPEFINPNTTLGISLVEIPSNTIKNRKLQFLNNKKIPAIVFSPDGQPESISLAGTTLFVAEGNIQENEFVGNALNNKRIRINPFTGRADYEY